MCGSRSTTQQFQFKFQNYFSSSIYLTVTCLYDKNVLKMSGTNLQYTLKQPHLCTCTRIQTFNQQSLRKASHTSGSKNSSIHNNDITFRQVFCGYCTLGSTQYSWDNVMNKSSKTSHKIQNCVFETSTQTKTFTHKYKIYLLNLELLFQVIQFCIVTSKFVYFLLIFICNMNIWILEHIKETVVHLTLEKRT